MSESAKESPPLHPFEVRISIGGVTWDHVLSHLQEVADH